MFINKNKKFVVVLGALILALSANNATEAEEPRSQIKLETAWAQKNLGSWLWQRGQIGEAISAWEKEAEVYQIHQLTEKEVETVLRIAQGYTKLGNLDYAIFKLEQISPLTKKPVQKARIFEYLGNAYNRSGELDEANAYYKKSLKVQQSLSTLNNLARLLEKQAVRAQLKADSSREGEEKTKYLAAVASYRGEKTKYLAKALPLAMREESSSTVRTLIEWGKQSPLTKEQIERGAKILETLPDSRTKAFIAINWAKRELSHPDDYWLLRSLQVAQNLQDRRAESYAWLELGLRAEKLGKDEAAEKSAQRAIALARQTSTFDSLYRAYWLTGRIARRNNRIGVARENYQKAIANFQASLQGGRNISPEKRLDFSTESEPLYREALSLALEGNPNETRLREALNIFAQLRLAQLQNYFGDNCFMLTSKFRGTAQILQEKNAVLLTSIMLEKETHLILQLPDGSLYHRKIAQGREAMSTLALDWYREISSTTGFNLTPSFWSLGEKLYSMIVRPFEAEIERMAPSQIIFVHDGVWQNIPMAALYDGQKYLVQKWAAVSSLGLNFVRVKKEEEPENPEPKETTDALAFGLGVAKPGWSALKSVEEEVENVVRLVGGEKHLDRDFTAKKFAFKLNRKDYSILHLATHGYFGGVAENSYVLAYDRPLYASDLEKYLTPEIELLVFSACETAISSDRSVLGLGGLALRNGVESVVGSFWQVQDKEQLEIIQTFYSYLQEPNSELATALQQVQIEKIEQMSHPAKWAALSLMEN